jgi:hypothetical protein
MRGAEYRGLKATAKCILSLRDRRKGRAFPFIGRRSRKEELFVVNETFTN